MRARIAPCYPPGSRAPNVVPRSGDRYPVSPTPPRTPSCSRSLLIANRGEVAVRIARTARELGVACVGVASDADVGASWLAAMDEVVTLGGAAPRDSYLDMERVLQAGVQTGCSAVHPGWGFLAERPALRGRLCRAARQSPGSGPPPDVMRRNSALKVPVEESDAWRAAGSPGIPASDGLLSSVDEAEAEQLAERRWAIR